MNYDCERPTSRVSRPPGGGSSNIFGGSDTSAAPSKTKANNPSFQSTIFSTNGEADKHQKPTSGMDSASISSIPMFNMNQRPTTAPCQGCRINCTNQSTVFQFPDYPENTKCQPGAIRRPNTAYKPANANTKSSLFSNKDESINEVKEAYRKPLSKKSTVFEVPPQPVVLTRRVSKTFQSTLCDSDMPPKFLNQMRPLKNFNESTIIGSSCESYHSSPVIMSSDFHVASLVEKPAKQNSQSEPSAAENATLLHMPADDDISKSSHTINAIDEPNKKVSDNFKSEGFEVSCGVKEAPACHSSFRLWSSDGSSCRKTENVKVRKDLQSQVFSADDSTVDAPLFSSGFCQSRLHSGWRANAHNHQSSTIFSGPKDR